MANPREPARSRQIKSPQKTKKISNEAHEPVFSEPAYSSPRPPRMVPDGIYSEQDLCHNLQIAPKLFRAWRRLKSNPLRPLPTETKQFFYLGAEVIAFWQQLKRVNMG